MNQAALIESIEAEHKKSDIPEFAVGDTLKVHVRIIEGNKERVQVFTGTVIARTGSGLSETVSLYRIAYGSGMERVFLIHSPRVAKIEVARHGKVRRSKLYYLRGRFGKAAKVREEMGVRKKVEKAAAPAEKAPEAHAPEEGEA